MGVFCEEVVGLEGGFGGVDCRVSGADGNLGLMGRGNRRMVWRGVGRRRGGGRFLFYWVCRERRGDWGMV